MTSATLDIQGGPLYIWAQTGGRVLKQGEDQGTRGWKSQSVDTPSGDHLQDPLQPGSGGVEQLATQGLSGQSAALPHLDRIQQSFGGHDVSGVQAHQGSEAQRANAAMGSRGFAMGDQVALASTDLHTVAHEAAHVVQQRSGVHPKSQHGRAADPLERHADAVADKVVAGESAEGLLSEMSGGSAQSMVQPKLNWDWDWTQKLGLSWKEGAETLWNQVNAGFNNTFLPLMGRLQQIRPLPTRFQGRFDALQEYSQYDNTNISMDQGRTIQAGLLPLLTGTPLDQEIAAFQEDYRRELAEVWQEVDGYNINAKSSPYQGVRARLSSLKQRVRGERDAPTYDLDLGGLRDQLHAIDRDRTQIREDQEREQREARDERERLRLEREAQERQALEAQQRREELRERLRTWRGRNIGPQMLAWLGSDTDQEPFIAVVGSGEVGRLAQLNGLGSNEDLLAAIRTARGVKPVLDLKDKPGATARRINALLSASNTGREAELMDLCGSMEHAAALLGRCNVGQAINLITLGGNGKEEAVHDLLELKNDNVATVRGLLDTVSGRGRADEVLVALTGDGALNQEQSTALLATPGMAGTPSETKRLLTNNKVMAADGLTTATELLSEKANADDMLKVLTKVGVDDAKTLSKGNHIHGTGDDVLWILNQNASVPQTKRLLDHKPGDWGRRVLTAHGHAQHNIVHVNDSLDNGKAVWEGDVCGAPSFEDRNGGAVTEAHVTANTGGMDAGGGNYHTQGFVNAPNDDRTMLLPRHGENYQEYDIKPWVSPNRGLKRIVLGSSKFYTSDHYATFKKYA